MINIDRFIKMFLLILLVSCTEVKKEYYENGVIKSKVQLDTENNWHGKVKLYNDKGIINFESNYYHGKPNGLAKFYYPDGKLRMVKPFEKGKIKGEVQGFDTLGQLNYIERHRNDKLLSYKWFNADGKVTDSFTYLNVDSLPTLSDFKVTFSHNCDTFISGDTVNIDIKHSSIFKNQIVPIASNGTIIYHWERDSFIYEFIPRQPGRTLLKVCVKVNDTLEKSIGTLKYIVK
ncbi:toxin-antitoxin system YwqK family antitoxin [Labilibaculum antarcticum]|uniref:MORN repeat protein n=1 Tax=Labilibaculum antarcticum TaxID=1717717 RepID=A0A1Y1CMG3_9BACT|nr:hypothetical protein [Labilibaculum antarcticum]BAX81474.1 hypothetical protein ALGA_3174 [Labilibaculum antarcticum]